MSDFESLKNILLKIGVKVITAEDNKGSAVIRISFGMFIQDFTFQQGEAKGMILNEFIEVESEEDHRWN